MMAAFFRRLLGAGRKVSYEDARTLAASGDAEVRARLAERADLAPEILYYLAADSSAEVRRHVAGNRQTPPQADLLLAGDADETVRTGLAAKIVWLAPGLGPDDHDRLRHATYEALELLARDQIPKVREILAEALKDVANAPPEVMRRLARDAALAVSAPVLRYSPVLTDEDLLEIIASTPVPGALMAISGRHAVGAEVCDAIAHTRDIEAIAALLGNASAQIREETLDMLVDQAPDVERWHRPLAERPHLSAKAAGKLARFVAANLLKALAARHDLAPDAAEAVAAVVSRRLDELDGSASAQADARKVADENVALMRAQHLQSQGRLDESTLDAALSGNDQPFVIAGLALLAGVSLPTVRKAVQTQSAKGMVAIVWKAGLSMGLCHQLQSRLLHLPPERMLYSHDGAFPLTVEDMSWQLEFLGG